MPKDQAGKGDPTSPGSVGPVSPARRKGVPLPDVFEGGSGSWNWLALLLAWIILRNILEGVLERPGMLGFDWREDVSLAMMVLHFPLFYLVLFLLLSLWIHLVSGRSMDRVVRAVSLAYGVLLLAPLVDRLVSGGPGFDLRYLSGPGGFLLHFWNPWQAVSEVSPGQRVEIAAACLLAAIYVWTTRRKSHNRPEQAAPGRRMAHSFSPLSALILAVGAGIGVYLLSALVGMWPALFARVSTAAADGLNAYDAVFRLAGLVSGESRRLAVCLALPFLALLPLFLWRLEPRRFASVTRRLPWTRLLHYSAVAPLGAYFGYLVFRDYLPGLFGNPLDWAAVLVLWAALAAAVLAAVAWNDLHDMGADEINAPDRPLVSGLLNPRQARIWAGVSSSLSLYLAWIVSYPALLLAAACLLLSWIYSAPPLRLKRFPLISTGTLAVLTVLSALTGFSLIAGEAAFWAFPSRLLWLLLLGITLGFTAKDLKDREGDAATGVVTLATLLPERVARLCIALLVAAGYLLAPILLPMGPVFWILAAVFALSGAAMTLRLRRPDTPLLLAFVLFALILAGFLSTRPALLQERLPDDLRTRPALLQGRHPDDARTDRAAAGSTEEDPGDARHLASGPRARTLAGYASVAGLERDLGVIHARETLGWPAEEERESALLRLSTLVGWSREDERLDLLRAQLMPPREALSASRRLVKARPSRALHWDLLFRAAQAAEGPEAGREVSRQAVRRMVRPGQFLANMAGLELSRAGASPEAAPSLAGAFLFHEKPGLLRVLLGDLRMFQGKPEDAARAYREALDWNPRLPEAWAGLGQSEYAQGRLEAGLAAFDRAEALAPDDPWIRNNRGVVLRDLGRLDQALQEFAKAKEIAPRMPEPVLNLAVTCEALGRRSEAQGWFAEALRLRPEWRPAEEGLRRTATQ